MPHNYVKRKCLPITLFSVFACPLALFGGTDLLDQLSEALIFSTPQEIVQAQVSGLVNLDLYYNDDPPPGLIFSDDKFFFNPRLTLYLDTFVGKNIYGFAKFRWDRGFDPGYRDNDVRIDEYFLRLSGFNDSVNFQIGAFATEFGNWSGRHDTWENPFINEPLPYEYVTVILDSSVMPNRDRFLLLQNNADAKKSWVPVIWGPVYTPGVSLFGSSGNVDYAVSIKNTALSSRPTLWDNFDFNRPTWIGRLGYHPNAAWNYGVSFSQGPYLQDKTAPLLPAGKNLDDYDQFTFGADLAWARGHLQMWAELIYSNFNVPNVDQLGTMAYYLEAKYKVSPRLYTAVRWGQQFFEKIADSRGIERPWDRPVARYDVVIGLRLNQHLQFKLQYSFSDQDGEFEQGQQFAATQLILKF